MTTAGLRRLGRRVLRERARVGAPLAARHRASTHAPR